MYLYLSLSLCIYIYMYMYYTIQLIPSTILWSILAKYLAIHECCRSSPPCTARSRPCRQPSGPGLRQPCMPAACLI